MIEKIDKIYEDMYTKPLSFILPSLLLISLEYKDYETYCILSYFINPLAKETLANEALYDEIEKILLAEDLKIEEINKLKRDSVEKYIILRSVDKDKVFMTSIREMEDLLNSIEKELDAKAPEGLAPLDAYEYNKMLDKSKSKMIEQKFLIEKQIALLRTYITNKLIAYRRLAENNMRKQENNKRIAKSKNIFIIHGHDEAKCRELENMLKDRFGLIPIVLKDQPDQGLTIIEKFEKYAVDCSYAFALFTPDDIVTNGEKQYFQARPNVIFELGWFYANLGRARVCILDQASEQSRIFSDLQGVLRMQFNNNISEKYLEIERELKSLDII